MSTVSSGTACEYSVSTAFWFFDLGLVRYKGTNDLQLERISVYYNETGCTWLLVEANLSLPLTSKLSSEQIRSSCRSH